MKKEFFKGKDNLEIIPNFILNIYRIVIKFFSGKKMKYLGPFVLTTVVVSFILIDKSLGTFLGIMNSMNLAAEAANDSSGKAPQCVNECKPICSPFMNACNNLSESGMAAN